MAARQSNARTWTGPPGGGRRAPGARQPDRRARPPRGVTLPELLVVVFIMGLIAALTVPKVARSGLWSGAEEQQVRQVVADLKLARRMSIERGADQPNGYLLKFYSNYYRMMEVDTITYYPIVYLQSGWQFEWGSYQVWFDPYGGAKTYDGFPSYFRMIKGTVRYTIHWDPATGQVWYEKG